MDEWNLQLFIRGLNLLVDAGGSTKAEWGLSSPRQQQQQQQQFLFPQPLNIYSTLTEKHKYKHNYSGWKPEITIKS